MVCGAVESLEIWNAETWAAMSADLDQSVADLFRDGCGI
jgi:DNA-binding transcriptional regulator/RsmH inhibitor MraZ